MLKNRLNLKLLKVFCALSLLAGGSACEFVPQEVSITTLSGAAAERADNAPYAGFTGITEANTLSANKVQIKWNASTDTKVIAYNIYDSSNFFFPKLLKTVLAPANNFTITGLPTVTLGTFRVKAATNKNVEDDNMIDLFAIPYGGISSANVTSSTTATVSFADISNADSAGVYCKSGSATEFSLLKAITSTVGVTSANLTGLVPGSTYTCRVNTTIADFTDNNTQTVSFIPIGQATSQDFVNHDGGPLPYGEYTLSVTASNSAELLSERTYFIAGQKPADYELQLKATLEAHAEKAKLERKELKQILNLIRNQYELNSARFNHYYNRVRTGQTMMTWPKFRTEWVSTQDQIRMTLESGNPAQVKNTRILEQQHQGILNLDQELRQLQADQDRFLNSGANDAASLERLRSQSDELAEQIYKIRSKLND